jgi:hypothetical protein
MTKINVLNKNVEITDKDYISLTDIARYKNSYEPKDVVKNWLRSRSTIEFLGLWEKINNLNFKGVEFDSFMNEAGSNSFVMSPQKWIKFTNALGIISKSGKFGGTYAHKDIAFEFASWVSVEFKLYLIKEFQRLKEKEIKQDNLQWNITRFISKINYQIHTDAIKNNLIPKELTQEQINQIYADEADVLNLALFGLTSNEWKLSNFTKERNIRDYANIHQLICLSNLENINALLINEKIPQSNRLLKLNQIAIHQMKLLTQKNISYLDFKKG